MCVGALRPAQKGGMGMRRRWLCALLAACALLCACGAGEGSAAAPTSPSQGAQATGSQAGYQPPPMAQAAFDASAVTGENDCLLDTSIWRRAMWR